METDLADKVMGKIAQLERRRVTVWLTGFLLVLFVLVIILFFALWRTEEIVRVRGSLELLTLFFQDPEVIGEFWQDSLTTFWEELPHRSILITVVAVILIVYLFMASKKGRRIWQMKLSWLKMRIKGK